MVRPLAAVRLGLRAAWRQPGLVILVWALFLGAALLAASPAWRWWSGVLSMSPEGDRLLDGLNASVLKELAHYDRTSTYGVILATFSSFLLATLVINPFISGGTLAVLYAAYRQVADGQQPARVGLMVFFKRAAEHYGVFLRLLLLAGVLGVVLAIAFIIPLLPIRHIADTNNLELLYLLSGAMIPVALFAAFGVTTLLLDIARFKALREGHRRAWRALVLAVRFVWRNLAATLAIGITFALIAVFTFAVYFVVASAFTPTSWFAILLAIVLQQLFAFTRTGLRIAMLAAEVELVGAREPMTFRLSFGPAPPLIPPAAPPTPSTPIEDLPPLA